MRFYITKEWTGAYKYPPIDATQLKALKELYEGLESGQGGMLLLYHKVCYLIFAHEKHQYETSWRANKFFSPAICFMVLHCVTQKGAMPMASGISNVITPIMYSIHACMFRNVLQCQCEEQISNGEALAAASPCNSIPVVEVPFCQKV